MKSEMIIREYMPGKSQDDMDHLLDAYLTIWNHPDNLKFLSYTLKPFDEDTLKSIFSNHISMGVHYYVANGNNDISGIAVVGAHPIEGFELIGLGVHHDFKRKGIGKKLLDYVINIAVVNEYYAVDAIVFADNMAMLCLLSSVEFIPVHMGYNLRADGGDTLRMRKRLLS